MCTIRQKPEKTIHCIVWSKALFEGLYGSKDQQNIIEDIVENITMARKEGNVDHFLGLLFKKIFNDEVATLKESL